MLVRFFLFFHFFLCFFLIFWKVFFEEEGKEKVLIIFGEIREKGKNGSRKNEKDF